MSLSERHNEVNMSKNDITGDNIKTKPSSQKYRDNWERIFGDKNVRAQASDNSSGSTNSSAESSLDGEMA